MILGKDRPLMESFQDAFAGIAYVLRTQRNMRIHSMMTVSVLVLGWILHVSAMEILFLLSAVVFVIVTEMLNTGIEAVVDLVTPDYHQQARIAKNVAAGAVLVASMYALVVGYLVLGSRILNMLGL